MFTRLHIPLYLLLALCVPLNGCLVEINGRSDTVRGQGPLVQEFRDIGPITAVHFSMEGDLIIEPGTEVELRVEAQQNLLLFIHTYVRDGELIIETDRDVRLRPSEPIRFVLVAPDLQSIALSGSGDIQAGSFERALFALSVAGSGDLFMEEVTTELLEVSIAGSGNIDVAGSSTAQEISIAGSGDYLARELSSNTVSISIAGSGDGYVQVSDELTASLIGSGSVFYLGNPTITSSALGSGRVRMLDN